MVGMLAECPKQLVCLGVSGGRDPKAERGAEHRSPLIASDPQAPGPDTM